MKILDTLKNNWLSIILLLGCLTVSLLAYQKYVKNNFGEYRTIKNYQDYFDGMSKYSNIGDFGIDLVVFSDYACHYCSIFNNTLNNYMRRNENAEKINLIHMNTVLPGNEYSYDAAIAVECARDLGHFKKYHDELFRNTINIGTGQINYVSIANEVGISDTLSFKNCINTNNTQERVERDLDVSYTLGITNTPSFLINEKLYIGNYDSTRFAKLIINARSD